MAVGSVSYYGEATAFARLRATAPSRVSARRRWPPAPPSARAPSSDSNAASIAPPRQTLELLASALDLSPGERAALIATAHPLPAIVFRLS